MEQNQNELKNIINKNLKIFFKKEIKGNFLIKILSEVKDAMGQSINSFYHPDSSITVLLSGSYVFPDYDICKMIIGLHKSNMIFLSEEKQIKSINDTNYQASLKNSVIQHIKLRPYGSCFFRNNPILTGDRFLYFELPYTLFVICMKTIELLPNNTDKNIPTTSLIRKMSQMGLSALTLLENNMLDDIYPVCRGIIELFMSFLCLSNNKKAISKYNKLSEFEAKFSRCGQPYPDEFHDLYNNRKNPDDNVLHSYLHYGWVDDIPNYHKIVKRKPYSTKGLFKYLENENNKEIFSFVSFILENSLMSIPVGIIL